MFHNTIMRHDPGTFVILNLLFLNLLYINLLFIYLLFYVCLFYIIGIVLAYPEQSFKKSGFTRLYLLISVQIHVVWPEL